jgi:hypothetical protein
MLVSNPRNRAGAAAGAENAAPPVVFFFVGKADLQRIVSFYYTPEFRGMLRQKAPKIEEFRVAGAAGFRDDRRGRLRGHAPPTIGPRDHS